MSAHSLFSQHYAGMMQVSHMVEPVLMVGISLDIKYRQEAINILTYAAMLVSFLQTRRPIFESPTAVLFRPAIIVRFADCAACAISNYQRTCRLAQAVQVALSLLSSKLLMNSSDLLFDIDRLQMVHVSLALTLWVSIERVDRNLLPASCLLL